MYITRNIHITPSIRPFTSSQEPMACEYQPLKRTSAGYETASPVIKHGLLEDLKSLTNGSFSGKIIYHISNIIYHISYIKYHISDIYIYTHASYMENCPLPCLITAATGIPP